MSYTITGLKKLPDTDPQEYMLLYKDLDNQKPGYSFSTEQGTESKLHHMLKNGGMSEAQISVLFAQAK